MQLENLGFDDLDELYQEIILDHYKRPRNNDLVDDPDLSAEGFNPFCGDRIVFTAQKDDSEHIIKVGFQGEGCSISQASASIMTGLLKGKTENEASAMAALFRELLNGGDIEEAALENLGDLAALKGVRNFPIRIKCALLAWSTLLDALKDKTKNQ